MHPEWQKRWEDFRDQRDSVRANFYNSLSVKSVLLPHQFDREKLLNLFLLADKIRKIADTRTGAIFLQSLLPHISAMLLFAQPSTRTRLSFETACMILGIKLSTVSDLKTTSFVKDESDEDSVETLSQYYQVIVTRHPEKDFVEKIAWYLSQTKRPRSIINAGSKQDVHVTQALLDLYTIWRFKQQIDGQSITFCGNLKNSRVARSNLYLLAKNCVGNNINLVADPKWQIEQDVLDFLKEMNVLFSMYKNLNDVLSTTDVLYLLRDQVEYDENGNYTGDFGKCGKQEIQACRALTSKNIYLLHPNAIVLHPLPKNAELEAQLEKKDSRIVIWSQVRNGKWLRAALFAIIFGVREDIMKY